MAKDNDETHSVALTSFGNGNVRFQKGSEGRPETKEVNGNVTVVNKAIEPTPNFFDVSFTIGALQSSEGAETSSTLILNVPLPSQSSDHSYPEIEDKAARLLPPMLRALADLIEADIERVATEKADRQKG